MKYQILLVEDDAGIREVIADYFSAQEDEINIISAEDGEAGLLKIAEGKFDLAILDIMLSGLSGFDLCRELRKDNPVPVIFLTARGREEDKLHGYMLGCDDYVVKPFSLAVLYARVRALIKRARGTVLEEAIRLGGITLFPDRQLVRAEEKELMLTPKEFALLRYLMEHPNQVISREQLLVFVWGYDFEGVDRVVDNHIKKLRKKLGKNGRQIKTVVKKGYKIEER